MPRDKRPPPSTKILSAEEREINDGRITDSRTRKDLMSVIKSQMEVSSDPNILASPRQQLTNKVLACSMRMVNLHDDIHKLGNEIRDRNAVIADLDSKISWNQSRIDDETLQKHGNTANRDRLVEELAQAEQLGRIKDKQIDETDENLKVQNQKNVKLQGIVDTAEKGNLQIRNTLENCREQLTSALD